MVELAPAGTGSCDVTPLVYRNARACLTVSSTCHAYPATCPALLTAVPLLWGSPATVPKSIMVESDQRKACPTHAGHAAAEYPVAWPTSLMASAFAAHG